MSHPPNRKLFVGTLIGNTVEFYDFTIYAFFAHQIGASFFSSTNTLTSLMLTFSVFATGYLTRPFGALFFGRIGDKRGRKKALTYSIVIATASTVIIGLLPSYNSLGISATITLILLRLLQGFSVSGEEGGAAVFLSECFGQEKIGYVGSLVISTIFIGIILASITCAVTSFYLSEHQLMSWGWRIPFLLALPLGMISYYYRKNLLESPEFEYIRAKKHTSKAPVQELFSQHSRQLLQLIMMGAVYAISTCIAIVYLPHFYSTVSHIGLTTSLVLTTICLSFITITMPLIGKLSDRVGSDNVFKLGCFSLLVLGYPVLAFFNTNNLFSMLLLQLLFSIMITLVAAPQFAILNTSFPTKLRYTSVSFIFNSSIAIFSGTTPIVLILLESKLTNPSGTYLVIAALFSLVGFSLNKRRKPHLISSVEVV